MVTTADRISRLPYGVMIAREEVEAIFGRNFAEKLMSRLLSHEFWMPWRIVPTVFAHRPSIGNFVLVRRFGFRIVD